MTCEIKKSTHQALVVPIKLEVHFNADKLSVVRIDDYTCVVATADWQGKTKAVYCPPDSLVNTELPQFNFLAKDAKYNKEGYPLGTYARVRARNIRLIQSYGLLAPCDESEPIGKDMAPEWGIGHYDPPTEGETDTHPDVRVTGGEVAPSPEGYKDMPKYDIDSGMKYARKLFEQDEPIVATLKFNGCNGSFVYSNGEFHCRSRKEFKREFASPPKADKEKLIEQHGEEKGLAAFEKLQHAIATWNPPQNLWWRVLRENDGLQKFLRDNPDTVVWGEVIGQVKHFRYGLKPGQIALKVFDVSQNKKWLSHQEARDLAHTLDWVPTIREAPFNMEDWIKFVAEMPVICNIGGIEEGLILSSYKEKWNPYTGRSKCKLITPAYSNKY